MVAWRLRGVARFGFVVSQLSLSDRGFMFFQGSLKCYTPKHTFTGTVSHIRACKMGCKLASTEWLTQNHGGVCYRQYGNLQYSLITVPVRSFCLSLSPHISASHLSLSIPHQLACKHMHVQYTPDKLRLTGGFINCWHRKQMLWSDWVLALSCKTPGEWSKINRSDSARPQD